MSAWGSHRPPLQLVRLFAEERAVVAIVFADKLVDPPEVRTQRKRPRQGVWLFEDIGIFDRHFILDRIEFGASETLDHVQRIGMSVALQFGLVVEADRIDDESISLPLADGVAQPTRIGINWMWGIHRDEPECSRILVEDRNE